MFISKIMQFSYDEANNDRNSRNQTFVKATRSYNDQILNLIVEMSFVQPADIFLDSHPVLGHTVEAT